MGCSLSFFFAVLTSVVSSVAVFFIFRFFAMVQNYNMAYLKRLVVNFSTAFMLRRGFLFATIEIERKND